MFEYPMIEEVFENYPVSKRLKLCEYNGEACYDDMTNEEIQTDEYAEKFQNDEIEELVYKYLEDTE